MADLDQARILAPDIVKKVLIVFNPLAGSVSDPKKHEQIIRDSFQKHHVQLDVIRLDSPAQVSAVLEAAEQPYDLIVAAGGDGTVSSVAESLIGRDIPLGILPVGTGNVLAKALGIPMNIEKAIQMLLSDSNLKCIDAMRVNGRLSLLNASVGISSRTVSEIRREEKQRMGMFAYLWRGVKALAGFQPYRFRLIVDDNTYIYRAAEVVVVNPDFMGIEPFYWGDDVIVDDGCIDLFVIRGKTLIDLFALVGSVLWFIKRRSPLLMHIQSSRRIWFDLSPPQPVQIDGDIFGVTPVEIEILPASLKVAVPKKARALGKIAKDTFNPRNLGKNSIRRLIAGTLLEQMFDK